MRAEVKGICKSQQQTIIFILQMSKKHVALLSWFRQEAVSKPHCASLQTVSGNCNMENFLRQIKLSSDFSLTLPINGNELINKLSHLTIPETTLIEVMGNSDKLFVGHVNLTELSIRPKRTFSQRNFIYSTRLIARLNSTATSVTIEGEIQLTKFHPLLMLSSMAIYFIIATISFVQDDAFGIIALLIQAIFMLGVFYFVFRNAIKTSKEYFEKELYFLTNNSH